MADDHLSARVRLQRIAALPDADIDLATAALVIAAEEYSGLDIEENLAVLDALADQARGRLERAPTELERVRSLAHFLHCEAGFRGNLEAYYDPRNSFLNDVLSRGLGIPITLAVVYIEVGRRLGVRLRGVNFPGHFLVRYDGCEPSYLDPFAPERLLDGQDCERLLAVMSEGRVRFDPSFLEPVSARHILVRMLKNLKLIYFGEGRLEKAIAAIDRILLLMPDQAPEYRDRGVAHLKLEAHRAALEDLTQYLARAIDAPDRPAVTSACASLRARIADLH